MSSRLPFLEALYVARLTHAMRTWTSPPSTEADRARVMAEVLDDERGFEVAIRADLARRHGDTG